MDYYALENGHLPIELMMENAGLQLATFVVNDAKKEQNILIDNNLHPRIFIVQ